MTAHKHLAHVVLKDGSHFDVSQHSRVKGGGVSKNHGIPLILVFPSYEHEKRCN
jgi:hypothetical protein